MGVHGIAVRTQEPWDGVQRCRDLAIAHPPSGQLPWAVAHTGHSCSWCSDLPQAGRGEGTGEPPSIQLSGSFTSNSEQEAPPMFLEHKLLVPRPRTWIPTRLPWPPAGPQSRLVKPLQVCSPHLPSWTTARLATSLWVCCLQTHRFSTQSSPGPQVLGPPNP